MTTSERKPQTESDERARIPNQTQRDAARPSNSAGRQPVVLHGRPRTREGEEAYLRSMMEQAATDIAAGW